MRRPLATLATLVAALLAGGCGEGELQRVSGSTVRLTADEYSFAPKRVEVEGPRVRLVLRDVGRLTHNAKVLSTTEFDSEEKPMMLGGTPTAHSGETVEETIRLKPGTYRLACSIANHDDLGMFAELVVTR
jgi:uncharacterized cupredoxin-like copper-binding protein